MDESALKARALEAHRTVADLEDELAEIASSTASCPDDEHDAEGSTIGFERARVGALLEQARRAAAELDEACSRFAAGSYGRCERCGRPISSERLDALPTTSRCVDCAVLKAR